MSFKTKVIIVLMCIIFYLMGLTVSIEESNYSHQSQIESINDTVSQINIPASVKPLEADIKALTKEIKTIKSDIKTLKKTSRGEMGERRNMTVTAYSKDSCGKSPRHPQYGITASGKMVGDWYTIAAGPEIPMGTKIYIPYFKDKPNKGIFVKQDTGPAIGYGDIDVYMESTAECFKFGRRKMEVYVMGVG